MEQRNDNRRLHALRQHIDELLANGAQIVARDPMTLLCDGQTLKVKHGMLLGYSGLLDLVEPVSDHEWPDSLRQMAIELCIQQLDQAIRDLGRRPERTAMAGAANDS